MAYTFPAFNVVEYRIHYYANSQECINVLHYQNKGNYNYTNLTEALNDFLAKLATNANGYVLNDLAVLMSSEVTIFQHEVQLIYPAPRMRAVVAALNKPGQALGGCKAQNVQATIQKSGDQANRHNLGSFHAGGLPEDGYAGGLIVGDTKDALAQLAISVGSSVSSDLDATISWQPRILNKAKVIVDGKEKYVLDGSVAVTSTAPKDTLRTMRRRTLRVGI